SGSGITGTGLVPALTRIANQHTFQPFGTNITAKVFAYSASRWGQWYTTVVANTTTYGVFTTASGTTTYVAYNPGSQAQTVNFSKLSNGKLTPLTKLTVAPFSIASTSTSGASTTFTPGPIAANSGRLYLQPATGT